MRLHGVGAARAVLYAAMMEITESDKQGILSWVSHGIPLRVEGALARFERAAEEFGRAKMRARNRRDRWKRRRRLQEGSFPDAGSAIAKESDSGACASRLKEDYSKPP